MVFLLQKVLLKTVDEKVEASDEGLRPENERWRKKGRTQDG